MCVHAGEKEVSRAQTHTYTHAHTYNEAWKRETNTLAAAWMRGREQDSSQQPLPFVNAVCICVDVYMCRPNGQTTTTTKTISNEREMKYSKIHAISHALRCWKKRRRETLAQNKAKWTSFFRVVFLFLEERRKKNETHKHTKIYMHEYWTLCVRDQRYSTYNKNNCARSGVCSCVFEYVRAVNTIIHLTLCIV